MVLQKRLVADPTRLFVEHGLDHTVDMVVNGRAAITALPGALSHCPPGPTPNSGRIANPGVNGSMQHHSEPPRSKFHLTWFNDEEAHLLQSL
jgi:hypothetical protein